MAERGELPSTRVGETAVRIPKAELLAWLRARTRSASDTLLDSSRALAPAVGFEPAHFGLKDLARLSVWPDLGHPARSGRKLICI
jgi:hypothetical protein